MAPPPSAATLGPIGGDLGDGKMAGFPVWSKHRNVLKRTEALAAQR